MKLCEDFVVDFDREDPDALHGWLISTRHPGHVPHAEDWRGQFWWLEPEQTVWYGLFSRRTVSRLTDTDFELLAYRDWEAFRALWPRMRGVLGRVMRPSSDGERRAAVEALKRLCFHHEKEIDSVGVKDAASLDTDRGQDAAVAGACATINLVYWHGARHFPDRPGFDDAGWRALIASGSDTPLIDEPAWRSALS